MLNNERKFPKREPVWKPLFDILSAVSLFPSGENRSPGKTVHADLALGACLPVREKSVLSTLSE
jgi:hypothetical protein